MDSPTWKQIEKHLDQLLDLAEADRLSYIDTHIHDPALKKEILSLLEAEKSAPDYLDTGIDSMIPESINIPVIAGQLSGESFEIDRYRIEKELGRGGMSVVYLAHRTDGEFNQKVAVKIIQPFGIDREERFRRLRAERQILANLQHPNIARVFDGGITPEGWPYMVMEVVDGIPIADHCRKNELSLNSRLELFLKICDAVIFAHRNLIVHRDIKPGNILVTSAGEVKLLDFGIAKLLQDEQGAVPLTRTGMPLMTPEYAAPEQFRGETVTTLVDVYSLGVILYELLSDERPYNLSGKSLAEIEHTVCEREPEKPSQRKKNDKLDADLDLICMKALRKEPEHRYASVQELSEDIERFQKGLPILARPITTGYRIRKFVARNRTGTAVTLLFICLLTASIFMLIHQQNVTQLERDRAQLEAEKSTEVANFLLGLFEAGDPEAVQGDTLTARQLLNLGVEQSRALNVQPALQAEMFGVIGRAYTNLALYENAEPILQEALNLALQTFGEDRLEVAQSQDNLADLYLEQGRFDEAESLFRKALKTKQNLPEFSGAEISHTLNKLGTTLRSKGEYVIADSLYREALSMRRSHFGDNHPLVAESLSDLASNSQFLGDYASSELFFTEALQIQQNSLPANHWRIAATLNNFGALLYEKGDNTRADSIYTKALEIRKDLYGDMHPSVALTMNNIAVNKQRQGDTDHALDLYLRVLEIQRETFDENHPRIALTLNNLGMLYYSREQYLTAEPYLRQALEMWQVLLASDHPHIGLAYNNLGMTHFEMGNLSQAAFLQEKAVSIYQKSLVKPHHRLARGTHNLGKIRLKERSFEEAELLFLDALEQRLELLGEDDENTQTTIRYLIELYHTWNKPDKAAEYEILIASG
jgi:serine/threonine-protein kinase